MRDVASVDKVLGRPVDAESSKSQIKGILYNWATYQRSLSNNVNEDINSKILSERELCCNRSAGGYAYWGISYCATCPNNISNVSPFTFSISVLAA